MSDTEMAQAPPREEEDLFGDEASNAGTHASDEDRMDEEKAALEYHEDDASASAPVIEEQTAWVNVPQLPMRRTKETLLARLPNFVRYKDRPFDPATWDERDDDAEEDAEEVGDKHARSVLRTMSTIRWRWQDAGPSSYTPQSNARIVRWSDGSESLQIGSEFLDMTRHAEPSTQGMPLTYIYVPHPEEGLLEAECAVRTSLTFKPNVHSETHNKIASAIRHQRGMRVVASADAFGGMDPEREKERIERQLKDAEKRKQRERIKAQRESNDFDGDLDLGTRRHGVRGRASRSHVTEWSDDDEGPAAHAYDYEEEDDGFIVHDEEYGDEPEADDDDDMDRADRDIEAHERRRREEHQQESEHTE